MFHFFLIVFLLHAAAICVFLVNRYFVECVNFVFTAFLLIVYRRKIVGLENVPKEGGVLFAANHVSFLDGLMIFCALPKRARFFAHEAYIKGAFLNFLGNRIRTIRVLPGKKVVHALKEAREALKNGDWLIVYPEGGLTRTGQIKAFEPGFLSMLKGNEDVPIVPVYIGGLFGSMFSYAHGEKLKFWPRRLEDDVVVSFGKPIYKPRDAAQVKEIVEELGVDTMRGREHVILPPRHIIRTARKWGGKTFLVDSLGIELTGRKFLMAILATRRLIRREILGRDEKNVGLLVPMSVGGTLTNAALAIDLRTVVNLNYTFGNDVLNGCLAKANIKHVFTSKKMLERFPLLNLNANVICMEDLRPRLTFLDKMSALFSAFCLPTRFIEWKLGHFNIKKEDPITIVFTSGSTGTPKGAVLTQSNIAAVSRSFFRTTRICDKDVLLAILPLFHAFGYVGNFWMVFLGGCKGVMHYNPLEPKKIGELARKFHCTVMPSTPTFLRGFLKKCEKADFEHLDSVLTGAEKLPIDLIEAWQAKFGPRPTEGYGATELSPCPCVNLPDVRIKDTFQPYRRDGSAGRALSYLAVKVVDPDSGVSLPPNTPGMLMFKGPIVMQGYYDEPELTKAVIKDNWYITGDIAKIDEDGFIYITGRQSRMSKIGGEMIPHILIEESIERIVRELMPDSKDDDKPFVAVTSLPDEAKGEKIIVLHRSISVSPEEITKKMLSEGTTPLWVPRQANFYEVESIPLLGTGKLDLRAMKQQAEAIAAQ